MVVGDPDDPATEIGPLVAERQQERVDKYIALGQEEGARVVVGGNGRPDGIDKGWYVQPTVFADVDNKMRIAQEEIFGPVLAVIPYDDVDDAVRIANDSEFGLAGSVWTADEEQGMDVARRVRTGTYGVNQYTMDFVAPFGGFKASGIGREFGREGLEHYLELKSIAQVRGRTAPARRARRAHRHRHPQPSRGRQRAVRRDARAACTTSWVAKLDEPTPSSLAIVVTGAGGWHFCAGSADLKAMAVRRWRDPTTSGRLASAPTPTSTGRRSCADFQPGSRSIAAVEGYAVGR